MAAWWETNDAWEEAKTTDDGKWEKKEEETTWEASTWEEKKDDDQEAQWGEAKDSTWDDAPQGPPPATEFWDTQKYNTEGGVLSRKEDWELERDDVDLFNLQGRATAGRNFEKYDSVEVDISGNKADLIPVFKTFEEIFTKFRQLIPEALSGNLQKVQYITPTPVQRFAVPCGLVGRDIMCCAQTGSGKTAAFLIPSIGRMMKHHASPVGLLETAFAGECLPDTLVMTPTRELCIQIFEEAQKFCHRTPYRVARVYGGQKAKEQLPEIAKGADLLVATPGRLTDFISRGVINVSSIHILILDEADRMLDMGFETSVREIVENHGMPPKDNRQTMMFSATFPEEIQTMAKDYLYDYIWIGVGVMNSAVETVHQELKKVNPDKKFEQLITELDTFYASRQNQERMLVFVNAKDTAKWLDEQLYEKSFNSGALHGNLEQHERETNLGRFRRGEIDVMLATDVAARGLDIENVGVVVNYDMPRDKDTYIHRIGRTGRIGNEGKAITFLSCDDNDSSLESVELLKELVTVMQNSRATLPDWMQSLIESTEASKDWSWGGKDAREGQESNKWTGAGDSWWANADAGNADSKPADSWQQDDWGQQQQQSEYQ